MATPNDQYATLQVKYETKKPGSTFVELTVPGTELYERLGPLLASTSTDQNRASGSSKRTCTKPDLATLYSHLSTEDRGVFDSFMKRAHEDSQRRNWALTNLSVKDQGLFDQVMDVGAAVAPNDVERAAELFAEWQKQLVLSASSDQPSLIELYR